MKKIAPLDIDTTRALLAEPPMPTMKTHPHLLDDNGRRVQPD